MLVQPAISRPVAAPLTQRLFFFDNIRVVAMVLVIMQHVGQVYGPTGGRWPIPMEAQTAFILDPFFNVNRSFGMSLFFMIAGYFVVLSCDKKGPQLFLKDRLLRLGIPLVAWTLFMVVMQVLLAPTPATGYARGIPWPVEVGHMWFVQHLLIFSAVYAIIQMVAPRRTSRRAAAGIPSGRAIVLAALTLTLAGAVIDIWYDIDEWVSLLGFIGLAPFDVTRDLGLFVVGVLAARNDWVMRFPSKAGRIWLAVGLILAALWYAFRLALPGGVEIPDVAGSLLYRTWESFLCIGMCIGLTVLFRDLWNTQSSLMKKAAQAQYATFIFHVGVVLLFQWAFIGLVVAPFVKFLLVSLLSVSASFLLGYWVRKPLKL